MSDITNAMTNIYILAALVVILFALIGILAKKSK